jgi:hypothetical protein
MPSLEVIGVYPVPEAAEPCHLVEILVRSSSGFDPAGFGQSDPDEPRENWQTAYDERALNQSGDQALTESFELAGRPELLEGDVRLVFFIHYLDPARPILTPFGEAALPEPTPRPQRLREIEYEEP